MARIPVVIPVVGEIIDVVQVVRWLKRPGDQVAADEDLLEVTTDKMDVVLPSPSAGVLIETHAAVGDCVAVGTRVATIRSSKRRRR